jgi:pyruvate/2-oxoglutarate dehydrogenase complex dihydrolipoamide acyltransferase (E2) component
MRSVAVILPDLGASPETPILVSYWHVARGQRVWEGDRLVEVLVGPTAFDVPSPATGRLVKIHARGDDAVKPGAVLGRVEISEEDEVEDSRDA